MKKKLLIVLGILVAVGIGGSYGLYHYGRTHSALLPQFLVDNLGYAGIRLTYREAANGPGISTQLSDAVVESTHWKHKAVASRLLVGVKARWAWPPLALYVEGGRLAIVPGETNEKPKSANGSAFAALALKTLPVDLRVDDFDVVPYALKGAKLRIVASKIDLDGDGIKSARVHHELKVGTSGKVGWLIGARWGGESTVEHTRFRALDHAIAVGTFLLSARGQYDSRTEKWDTEIGIPNTKVDSPAMQGELALRFHAQGIGANSDAINVEGKIKTKNLKVAVQHPKLRGEVVLTVEAEVTREQALALKATGDVDLTKAEILPGWPFTKPAGTALTAHLEMAGKENHIALSRGDLKWADVPLTVGGEIAIGPRVNANLTFKIPQTPIPQIAKATVGGEVAYRGAIDDPSQLVGQLHVKLPHGQASVTAQVGLHPIKIVTYAVRGAGRTVEEIAPLAGLDPARIALTPDTKVSGTSSLTLPAGHLVTTSLYDGHVSTVTLKTENLPAEQVVPEIVRGKLSTGIVMHFSGTTDDEKKRTLHGGGSFVITEGTLPALRLSKKPLEELKNVPLLGGAIRTADIDDKFTRLAGDIHLDRGTARLTGILLKTPQFDLSSDELWIDPAKNLNGKLLWIPHGLLMRPLALELLRDHATGKTAIPLSLGGTVANPTAKVDVAGLLARISIKPAKRAPTKVGRLGRHLKR